MDVNTRYMIVFLQVGKGRRRIDEPWLVDDTIDIDALRANSSLYTPVV
jgi:hypothetical protein